MSSVAVMQPYFFPYLGYFQLVNAVDHFVFYDDVNFITNGWIHRNRILIDGKPKYFTIPCKKASQNKLINEIDHALDEKKRKKLLKQIKYSYGKAPFFENVYPIIEEVLTSNHEKVSKLAAESILQCSKYLGIDTDFKFSSMEYENTNLERADRLIDITKKEGAKVYINALGGTELYDKEYFKKQEVRLCFLNPELPEYGQFDNPFVPNLSIIDVIMLNAPDKVSRYLENYELM